MVERHLHGIHEVGGQFALLLVVRDVRRGVLDGVRVGVKEGHHFGEAALDHRHPVAEALAHHARDGEADLAGAAIAGGRLCAAASCGRECGSAANELSSVQIELHLFVPFFG